MARAPWRSGWPTRDVLNPSLASDDGAVTFPTSSDFLTVTDNASLDLGNAPFSIEFWANRRSNTSDYEIILAKGSGAYAVGVMGDSSGNGGRLGLISDATTIAATGTKPVPVGSWHHYVITRSGTGTGKHHFYVDGVEDPLNFEHASAALTDTATNLTIGKDAVVSDPPFLGSVDEVALRRRRLPHRRAP